MNEKRDDEPYLYIKLKNQEEAFSAYVNYDAKRISGFLPIRYKGSTRTKYINLDMIEHLLVNEDNQKYIYDFFGELVR